MITSLIKTIVFLQVPDESSGNILDGQSRRHSAGPSTSN